MSGRPALVTRYTVTLTAAHFPVGDEVYDFGITLADDDIVVGRGISSNTLDAAEHPTMSDELEIEGAGDPDGASTEGAITFYAVVAEPGLEVTVPTPAVPA